MGNRQHRILRWLPTLAGVVLLSSGCLPAPEPAIDQATVLSDNTSVRIDATSSSRTLFRVHAGDRVDILEKQGSWYLIRDVEQVEGWMAESTLIRDTTRRALEVAVVQARDLAVQNTAETTDRVNLRMAPGRDSDVIRQLRRGTRLEVLGRETTPRPESNLTDIWYQVRPTEAEVGWVFFQLMDFDAPEPLRPFMEGRTYTAAHLLKTIDDPDVGEVDWYVVAERRNDTEPSVAFDGIRVFIWNLEEHQYETTLRLRDLEGVFPLVLTGTPDDPGFRFHVRGPDGEPVARDYVMRETLPRLVR
jgi:SH3-like domain-containing protein